MPDIDPSLSLVTIADFDGADGSYPDSGLITDANGDIFSTTEFGGAGSDGTIFEITKTAGSYASLPTDLVDFDSSEGDPTSGALFADASGNLFAMVYSGPDYGEPGTYGSLYEVTDNAGTYAGTPTLVTSFNSISAEFPNASLITDANGDLFGTTSDGGTNGSGTVFEITKTGNSYASTPTLLVNFADESDGFEPSGGLIADSSGDLFGIAYGGGNGDVGTLYEIAKAGTGYANTPNVVFSFNGTAGSSPTGNLITDAEGDLFGTAQHGGAYDTGNDSVVGDGTVYELVKTSNGYASAPTVLVSFNGTDGSEPFGSLITDTAGDLFGVTNIGGADNDGTVFEILESGNTYASTPTILFSFDGTDGANPVGDLSTDAAGDLFGTTAAGGANNDGTVFEITDSGFVVTPAPTLTTLVDFNGQDGNTPFGGLVMDASGDLLGTTAEGGTSNDDGTAFEVTKSGNGYDSTPAVLYDFNASVGSEPAGGLFADAEGDLFGTTNSGGSGDDGTVFEITKSDSGYAGTPMVLADFNGSDGAQPLSGGLFVDDQGDLFGTTEYGGAYNDGTVFEIAKTDSGYATAPTVLVSFNIQRDGGGSAETYPYGPLISDANGDLFGIAEDGGASSDGTVFEIAKSDTGYADAPAVLVTFNGANGESPGRGLVADAAGDLFGVTNAGGANDNGTVFEIAKTANGYAITPAVLVTFNTTDGSIPDTNLILDANGDLFGVTEQGGTSNDGTVFEIVKSGSTYASTPKILFNFDGSNGANPDGILIADAEGDLFGTTAGGGSGNEPSLYGNGDGTVFEITNSGFVTNPVCLARGMRVAGPGGEAAVEDLRPGDEVNTAAGIARVRWVGRRGYDGRFINGNHLALPVTITAGALADGIPARDLVVSPGHGIWMEDVLVPAWRLVNGVSVTQARYVERVEYFNVELEGHGLLEVQGALVESFLDDGEFRNQFANVGEYWALYPDAPLCRDVTPLPRVESGMRLAAIQERVNFPAGLAPAIAEAGTLRGFVDMPGIDGWVQGWAQDLSCPETAVTLRVYAHGRYVARVLANAYRADLRAAGLGSGCHAFSCRVPAAFAGDVEVRREADDTTLAWTIGAQRATGLAPL